MKANEGFQSLLKMTEKKLRVAYSKVAAEHAARGITGGGIGEAEYIDRNLPIILSEILENLKDITSFKPTKKEWDGIKVQCFDFTKKEYLKLQERNFRIRGGDPDQFENFAAHSYTNDKLDINIKIDLFIESQKRQIDINLKETILKDVWSVVLLILGFVLGLLKTSK